VTTRLAPHERALLELLVRAYEEDPDELYVVVFNSQGSFIKHAGMPMEYRDDGAALAGLDASGMLLVQNRDSQGRPKSFYLPNTAPADLAEAKQAADQEEREAAAQAAAAGAGGEPLSLAEALERMIAMQRAHPGGFFTPYDTRPRRSIGYSALSGQTLPLTHGEFARLLTVGALLQHEQHRGVYYLTPQAADILAAEQRLQSVGPLATAESRIRASEERRMATAEWVGWFGFAAVVLLAAVLWLNREEQLPLTGLVEALAFVGVSGLLLAELARRGMRAGVGRLLRWWFDPESGERPNRQ